MKTATTVKENAGDILADAKKINEPRLPRQSRTLRKRLRAAAALRTAAKNDPQTGVSRQAAGRQSFPGGFFAAAHIYPMEETKL